MFVHNNFHTRLTDRQIGMSIWRAECEQKPFDIRQFTSEYEQQQKAVNVE